MYMLPFLLFKALKLYNCEKNLHHSCNLGLSILLKVTSTRGGAEDWTRKEMESGCFQVLNIEKSQNQRTDSHINQQCWGLISGTSEHLNTCERCITVLINERPQRRSIRRRCRSAQFIYPKREEAIL